MQGLLARLKSIQTDNEVSCPSSTDDDGILKSVQSVRTRNGLVNGGFERNKPPHLSVSADDSDTDLPSIADTARTDDAIDFVMASNRTPSRTRNRISASTPQRSRTRSSRLSVNSETNSEKDDLDISVADSDDDELSASRSHQMSSAHAWDAFESTVKSIDNSSPEMFTKKPKPNFVSSNTFQQVMMDMYGNTEYGNTKGYTLLKKKLGGMARGMNIASRMFAHASAKGQEDRENAEHSQEEQNGDTEHLDDCEAGGPETATKGVARRGWKIMKRQVNESVMEQKTQSTKLNWTMLQHTLKQMSNVERTRQDLYERYGIVPSVQPDGTTQCMNRMLSDRARAQLYKNDTDGQENRRPMSLPPSPAHTRSRTQLSYHKRTRDGAKSARLPNIGTFRPKTAIR